MHAWTTRRLGAAVCLLALIGCGGDDSGGSGPPPDEDPLEVAATPTANGNGQTGPPGAALPEALRVVITRASEPEEGVDVTWATTGGGSLDPTTSTTGADGIASSTWTLGPTAGAQAATATVADAEGSPVTFTATAEDDEPPPPPPPPADATIQVLGPPDNMFSPAEVTIQVGQTVEWVWPAGAMDHNVSPDDEEPTSSGSPADGPKTYSFTFNTAGTYAFFCVVHGGPGGAGMSGTVTVEP
ncbi:MAG TPA: plastocyanin/azurin family copper-binding protein [Gemmatimonadales bacterium]|nr:plastocyanin/azurin family copper-binding protein [Gemmatimonadales bacterium]